MQGPDHIFEAGDRAGGQLQLMGDLPVRLTVHHQTGHLELAPAERGRAHGSRERAVRTPRGRRAVVPRGSQRPGDLEQPDLWVESYHVPTWIDYVRHNMRRTKADADNVEQLRALHRGPDLPKAHRMIERQTVPIRDDMPIKENPEVPYFSALSRKSECGRIAPSSALWQQE